MKQTARPSSSRHQEQQEDRISSLPDVLLICILSFLNTKQAVQSCILSKRWINLWTSVHALSFESSLFRNPAYTLDNFIDNVLSRRDNSVKLDSLYMKVFDHNMMDRLFSYALSHRVPSLTIDGSGNLSGANVNLISWENFNDSMIRLALMGTLYFGKFVSFVALVSLRLDHITIIEYEPFSCFPNLKELFLVNCKMHPVIAGIEVVGSKLLKLVISSCFFQPIPYAEIMLETPKLMMFVLKGLVPMFFDSSELLDLDTVHVDCFYSDGIPNSSIDMQKLNLISMLKCLKKAKFVHLSPTTAELLSMSHKMIIDEQCAFENIKVLNLIPPPNKPTAQVDAFVVNYLRKNCPHAVVKTLSR